MSLTEDAAEADREYVQLLYLVAHEGHARVEAALKQLLTTSTVPSVAAVQAPLSNHQPQEMAAAVTFAEGTGDALS